MANQVEIAAGVEGTTQSTVIFCATQKSGVLECRSCGVHLGGECITRIEITIFGAP
jgi:hypothetical protein